MVPRSRFLALAIVVFTAGCNAILGIDDHELASDAEVPPGDDDARDAAGADATLGDDAMTGTDGAQPTGDSGPCSPGATQCSGASAVQTCGVDGTWGAVFTCATNVCDAGSCTGATSNATSCNNRMGTGIDSCGASGTESCCTSLEVPTGTYFRTFDEGADGGLVLAADGGPAMEADPATISGFRLDKFEVTIGRFRQYVSYLTKGQAPGTGAGKHAYLNGGQGLTGGGDGGTFEPGWNGTADDAYIHTGPDAGAAWNTDMYCNIKYGTWTPTATSTDDLPVSCENWAQAYAFCIWDGGFLPSEAEWEYVAAGGAQQRPYPWGTSYDASTGYSYSIVGCEYPSLAGSCTGTANIAPPGTATKGAGVWGQMDLAGNVWEWTYDYLGALPGSCVNCAALTSSSAGTPDAGVITRVDKGGAFSDPSAYVRVTTRGNPIGGPYTGVYNIGFRCARTP